MSGLVLGVDIGTSGVRAVAMDADYVTHAQGAASLANFGSDHRNPRIWWAATEAALGQCLGGIDRVSVRAIAVDGTSGTVLPVDANGSTLADPLMYNDRVDNPDLLARIAPHIPPTSAAHGASSGLAKMLHFQHLPEVKHLLHQADWIAGRLSGRFGHSDSNNALKSGFDPVAGQWPDWMAATGLRPELLPEVFEPGTPLAPVQSEMAARFGLRFDTLVVAGTTDGCASFIATGADRPGDAVTVLGSTLTLKLLCDRPIFAPKLGVYSHRILGQWLAGGASNTGGKVLAQFFDRDALVRLSDDIDPETSSGLDYYPLLVPGERFPVSDPQLPPRLAPRPASDAAFLKGMFEGIAAIEARGYAQMTELGAPKLRSVRSTGGGAANPVWTRMRQKMLGVDFPPAASVEAAAGSARLALIGARTAGLM